MKQQIARPNIFKISTKELSQDAFIVWLLQWAAPQCIELDVELHECGKSFLALVMGSAHQADKKLLNIEAGRQWDYIDVWAEIYFTDGSKTLLVIEDKTFSDEHSNQLERYRKQAEDYCANNNFSLVCTYFKIGSEPRSVINTIKERGFNIVTRNEIIERLKPYRQTNHSILKDYIEYIDDLEKAHIAFENLPLKDWKDLAWVGFYQYIEANIPIIKWHWVNNPSGGFWNLCLTWRYWHKCIPLYMQIEEEKLCFKIALGQDDIELDDISTIDVNAIQDFVFRTLTDFVAKENMHIVKRPGRMVRRGNYRTFSVIDFQDWCGDPNCLLDKDAVLTRLHSIIAFYEKFMRYLNSITFEVAGIAVDVNDDE